jgi:putative Mg2+ transporter-C (MgtC) family protein
MSTGDQLEIVGWVALALGLGALIGLQREFRGHEAGIRTSAIVCGAAALFGQISSTFADTDRIAAGVVQGIGFLCAGLIFQRRRAATGVTTAATVWGTTAIGLAVSAHLWLVAIAVTLFYIAILELAPVSETIQRRVQGKAPPVEREDDVRNKRYGAGQAVLHGDRDDSSDVS